MGRNLSRIMWLLFGAVIVLQFVMPFIYPVAGYDAWIHLNWLEQFPRLFREGNLYPRWMPDSFWGFGSPAFYFYPPFAYWCGSLISFINPSPVFIYQILGLLGTIVSVWTCYLYLRSIVTDKHTAFIGALIYGVFPYRFIDLYLRNALGEHIAFVFFPLIFLSIESALKCTTRKQIVSTIIISAIGWSGILLTNIPTSVIVIYTVPIYFIIRARSIRFYKSVFAPLTGAIIGLMIAAIYLFPIPEYISSIKLSHFWDLQKLQGNSGYAIVDILYGKFRYFYVGLLIVLASAVWLFYRFYLLRKKAENKSILTVILVFLAISLAFQIPYIFQPLFEALPFFNLIQYSYRWDILIVFAASVFIAINIQNAEKKSSKCFTIFSSLVTIILAVGYFFTMDGVHWQYKPVPGHIDPPEYLSSSVKNDFVIAENDFKSHVSDSIIVYEKDSLQIHVLSETPLTTIFLAALPESGEGNVFFHRMVFPAWSLQSLSANGSGIQFSDSLHRICAILQYNGNGPNSAKYILELEKNPTEKNGELITCIGLSILSILIIIIISSRNPKAS